MKDLIANCPVTLSKHQGSIAPIIKYDVLIAVFNPHMNISDIAIQLWIIGLTTNVKHPILIAHISVAEISVKIGFTVTRRIFNVCIAKNITL